MMMMTTIRHLQALQLLMQQMTRTCFQRMLSCNGEKRLFNNSFSVIISDGESKQETSILNITSVFSKLLYAKQNM